MKALGLVIVILSCALLACGNDVELRPELQAQLDEYENLIEEYQTKFVGARGNPPAFKDVADAYSRDVKSWMAKWDTLAPTLSQEESKAVKARIDALNKRVAGIQLR
jgi:hypothetical protein